MAASSFTATLITMGVNAPPNATALTFAESDAANVYRLFSSPSGPTWTSKHYGFGGQATSAAVDLTLFEMRGTCPDFLTLYFSGHGSDSGIALADRHYYYGEIVERLAGIQPKSSLLILDVCHAAGYQHALMLKEAAHRPAGLPVLPWRQQLALSVPGSRYMYSSKVDQNSHESAPFGGHFTWSLLRALESLPGDLGQGKGWISDHAAFVGATQILHRHFGNAQTPQSARLDGTLPIFRGAAR